VEPIELLYCVKCNISYETILTITSKTITTARALIPDLIEWGLSSWLNMDMYFLQQKCRHRQANKKEIGKQAQLVVKK